MSYVEDAHLTCHGRAWPGRPSIQFRWWMAASRAAMTTEAIVNGSGIL